jgi:hypothetical protein
MEELVQDHRAHGTYVVGVHSQLLRPRDLLGDDPIEQVPGQRTVFRGFHGPSDDLAAEQILYAVEVAKFGPIRPV